MKARKSAPVGKDRFFPDTEWQGLVHWLKQELPDLNGLNRHPLLQLAMLLVRFPSETFEGLTREEPKQWWSLFSKLCAKHSAESFARVQTVASVDSFARHELGFTPKRSKVEASRLRLMENLRFELTEFFRGLTSQGHGAIGVDGIFGDNLDIKFFRVGNKWTRHYDGSYQPWFIMNFIESLEKFGVDAVRRCPRCDKIYIRTGRRLGCGDRCKAKTKAASLKQDPTNRMVRAFDAFRESYKDSHSGCEPGKDPVKKWWEDYQKKRKKKRKATSSLTWEQLLERCK